MRDVKACVLYSHFYWTLWAVLMSGDPDINFGYIEFGFERFSHYMKMKKKWFCQEK